MTGVSAKYMGQSLAILSQKTIMSQTEKVHVRVLVRRSASRGGQYFFIAREDDVLPIEKLATVEKPDELESDNFLIEANLEPSDLVVQIDFTVAGSMEVHSCKADEMIQDEFGRHNTIVRRTDPTVLERLAENPNLPWWLQKRLAETLGK